MASRVTRVQGSQNTTSTSSWPNTGAYGSNVTAGDLLVCAGRFNGLSSAPSISDTVGTVWTNAGGVVVGSSYYTLWWGLAGGTGANTITLGSAGSFPEFVYAQWNNPDGSWTAGSLVTQTPAFQFSPWIGQQWTASIDDLVLSVFGNETANYNVGQWNGNMAVHEVAGQNTGWCEFTRNRQVTWTPKVIGGGGTVGQITMNFIPTGLPTDTTPRHRQTPFVVAQNSSSSSLSKAFDANVLSGSTLFVWAGNTSGHASTAVTDTLGTTYTKIVSAVSFSGGIQYDIWAGQAPSSGANTVAVTYAASGGSNFVIPTEYQNGTAIDGNVSATGFPSPAASGNLTTTQPDTLIAWVTINQQYVTSPVTATGWDISNQVDDPNGTDFFGDQFYIFDQEQTSAGTYSFSGTYPGFSRNSVSLIALTGAGSPPPGPGTSRARAYII